MRKSQYRWQMTQPVPATTPIDGLQPDRPLFGPLGDAAGAAGGGRELRLPAVAQAQLLPAVTDVETMTEIEETDERDDSGFGWLPFRPF